MFVFRRYRVTPGLAAVVVILVAGVLIAGIIVSTHLLDPGHKGDTSSDLATPVLATPKVREFDVIPDQSRVDFTTEVTGLGTVQGVFPVQGGTIRLEPVGSELRVHVYLEIDVDQVDSSNLVKMALRAAMKTGDYPIAFYVAESRELVAVTEEEIQFTLDGTLEVHNVKHAHTMSVRAQLVGSDMWAIASSELDLANHDVKFPPPIETTSIMMAAHLQAVEVENPDATSEPSQ
jgi:hypothetical protein